MSLPDAIITLISADHIPGTRQARYDWAEVTGQEVILKPDRFRHEPSGKLYADLAGGIAYPTEKPGCIIIAGITGDGMIDILEYQESHVVFDLLSLAVDRRYKYGYGLTRELMNSWWGDAERYTPIVSKVSAKLEEKLGFDRGFYIQDPVDYREPHAFSLYMWQLRNSLAKGQLGKSSIPELLAGNTRAISQDNIEHDKPWDHPGPGLLGGLVHTIINAAPWEEDAESRRPLIIDDVMNENTLFYGEEP